MILGTKKETSFVPMKERQRQMREAAILDAAKELLSQKGFAAMTLEDVISEVGISKPTFYQHFASKEELGVSVLLRTLREAHVQLNVLQNSLPPDAALHAIIAWAVDKHFSPRGHSNLVAASAFFNNQVLRDAERELAKAVAELIARGQREGSIKMSRPPLLVALAFQSILKDPVYGDELIQGNLDLATLKAELITLLLA